MNMEVDRIAGLSGSLAIKAPVRCATTVNVPLSGLAAVDGIAIVEGDRVLVRAQSNKVQNGIYTASSGPWKRALDFNKTRDVVTGTTVITNVGITYGKQAFYVSTPNPISIGTSQIDFDFRHALDDLQSIIDNAIAQILGAADDILAAAWAAAGAVDIPTRAYGVLATIPTGLTYLRTGGYDTVVDGGGGLYRKKNVLEADRAGDFTSANGLRFELATHKKNIRQFGAKSTATPAANYAAIQAAADLRGYLGIPDDPDGDYGISDTILIRSNTVVEWTGASFIKLAQASTIGAVIVAYHEGEVGNNLGNSTNVIFLNPHVDGGNLGYVTGQAYGENGIGGAFCNRFIAKGGIVRNCRAGAFAPTGTGGKGIQVEASVFNCTTEGVTIHDCTIGVESGGDVSAVARNIRHSNLQIINCGVMISVVQTASPPVNTVAVNTFVFDGIQGYNCGKDDRPGYTTLYGAICIDRAANAFIKNCTLFNDAAYGSIAAVIKHYRGSNLEIDITFSGDASNFIDSYSPASGFGASGDRRNIHYKIRHVAGSVVRILGCTGGDASNFGSILLEAQTATISSELFDTGAAQTNVYGKFFSPSALKSVEGPLADIAIVHTRNYPVTAKFARVGSLQDNQILFSYTTGAQIFGTVNNEDLILERNLVEKLRLTANGVKAVLQTFANNAAAASGGLSPGEVYKTSTGEVRIVV